MWRGSSFLNAPPIAGIRIVGSVIVATDVRLRTCSMPIGFWTVVFMMRTSVERAGEHREMLDDRAERSAGK